MSDLQGHGAGQQEHAHPSRRSSPEAALRGGEAHQPARIHRRRGIKDQAWGSRQFEETVIETGTKLYRRWPRRHHHHHRLQNLSSRCEAFV